MFLNRSVSVNRHLRSVWTECVLTGVFVFEFLRVPMCVCTSLCNPACPLSFVVSPSLSLWEGE